jgi:hypothetical protein
MANENLGAAERIIQTLLTYNDHLVHNRPGMVVADAASPVRARWFPVTHKDENGERVIYRLEKKGKSSTKQRVGVLRAPNSIVENGRSVGTYRNAGLFPEVAAWMYRQVAEVWKLDNEFSARWASHAFGEEHRDLKVVLAAFMLVQSRRGEPVRERGEFAFFDEDYRDVGEAMLLLHRKDGRDLNPKLLLRVHDFLQLPEIQELNRELGFGRSARRPFTGRWQKAVEKWLRYREENPRLLAGLIKAGFRQSVMALARRVGYKPADDRFFELLRWKQQQAKDGRRTLAIGKAVATAETWQGLSEAEICARIVAERPGFKRIVGLLPKELGITRAIVAAAIEAGSLSRKDLIIQTPTLEELGLLTVPEIRERWERAVHEAEDLRAANIASRVQNKATQEKLQEAADNALKSAAAESMRGLRVYFFVDISGSMAGAIEAAKLHLARFLQGFPAEQLHVAVFNTTGREIRVPHASAAGVNNAFRGIAAGGGTDYGAGVRALATYRPAPEEDVLFIFVGDEQAVSFEGAVRQSGLNPLAFGLVPTPSREYGRGLSVRNTAAALGIPCFEIEERTFGDTYAIPRTIRALVLATPVGTNPGRVAPRVSIVDLILKTDLLKKPVWAA